MSVFLYILLLFPAQFCAKSIRCECYDLFHLAIPEFGYDEATKAWIDQTRASTVDASLSGSTYPCDRDNNNCLIGDWDLKPSHSHLIPACFTAIADTTDSLRPTLPEGGPGGPAPPNVNPPPNLPTNRKKRQAAPTPGSLPSVTDANTRPPPPVKTGTDGNPPMGNEPGGLPPSGVQPGTLPAPGVDAGVPPPPAIQAGGPGGLSPPGTGPGGVLSPGNGGLPPSGITPGAVAPQTGSAPGGVPQPNIDQPGAPQLPNIGPDGQPLPNMAGFGPPPPPPGMSGDLPTPPGNNGPPPALPVASSEGIPRHLKRGISAAGCAFLDPAMVNNASDPVDYKFGSNAPTYIHDEARRVGYCNDYDCCRRLPDAAALTLLAARMDTEGRLRQRCWPRKYRDPRDIPSQPPAGLGSALGPAVVAGLLAGLAGIAAVVIAKKKKERKLLEKYGALEYGKEKVPKDAW